MSNSISVSCQQREAVNSLQYEFREGFSLRIFSSFQGLGERKRRIALHSCDLYICERFIYYKNQPAYSAAGKFVDWSWEYINRSQTHECKIRTEAAQFLEKEYRNGIFIAVYNVATWPDSGIFGTFLVLSVALSSASCRWVGNRPI